MGSFGNSVLIGDARAEMGSFRKGEVGLLAWG